MKKLSLLIQVYNGGQFFSECLNSLIEHCHIFYKIYVSINKSSLQETDIKTAEAFISDRALGQKVLLYKQEEALTSTQHSYKFYSDVLNSDDETDFFMILCHDDILLPDFKIFANDIDKFLSEDTILNPARKFFNDNFVPANYISTYYGLKSYTNQIISKERYAMQNFDRYPDTNISGLVLSHSALGEYRDVLPLFSYGYRAEYIVMCLASIKIIKGTTSPIVGIRKHIQSEGAKLFHEKMIKDELLYRMYLFYSSESEDFGEYMYSKLDFNPLTHAAIINKKLFKQFQDTAKFRLIRKALFLKAIKLLFPRFIKRLIKKILVLLKLRKA